MTAAPRHSAVAVQPVPPGEIATQKSISPLNILTHTAAAPAAHAPNKDPLAAYLDLEIEARAATSIGALRFLIVNSTRKMAPFDQAFLLEKTHANGEFRITAGSSVDKVDRDGEVARNIEAWANHPRRSKSYTLKEGTVGNLNHDSMNWEQTDSIVAFPHALWQPLVNRAGETVAILLSLSAEQWLPQHIALMASLSTAYAHAWTALKPVQFTHLQRVGGLLRRKSVALGIFVAFILVGMIPVPLTALAPAEVVGAAPSLIVAPIDGVVSDILVEPGTEVVTGQLLLTFHDTKLRNDVEIASRAKSVAEAKYFKVLQSAVSTQKDMQDLSIAKAELSVAEAELSYSRDLLARSQVHAPRDGIFIYSSKSDWIGKPVSLGERLMEIVDPKQVELRVDVGIADAIALKQGAQIKLFLDGDPLHPILGTLDRTSYRAVPTGEHQLAFKAFAHLDTETPLHIGLHGTARLSGEKIPLGLYLIRHPAAVLRQKFGL